MKCLVVSDTHTNTYFYKQILKKYCPKEIDLVIHLGDNYNDALLAHDYQYNLICVPGTRCSQYQDSNIDNRRMEIFESWRCFLSHTPSKDYTDLATDEDPVTLINKAGCDVFFHGHTHVQAVRKVNNVIILNPGHIKSKMDRGQTPGYMLVTFSLNLLEVSCYDGLTHSCTQTHEFSK